MPKIETPTSMADLAEKAGRHYRSRHLERDDAPAVWWQRVVPVASILLVLASAILLWKLTR